ncbi:MAG TPA: RNB domain-containing ribonuclease, partial [Proteobacteria bacterium]|nr:RNB domain-containing ribonuclease [Pseudomonadota bacterium]
FEPGFHSGLGVDAYVQVTSPIRRYTDMLMQRQLSHWLRTGKPLYSEDVNFLMRAKDAERRFVELRQAAEQIEQYWKMVYIQQNMDAEFTVVLPKSGIPYIYELVLPISHPLPPWMTERSAAKAKVKSVDPDTMSIELDIIEGCPLPWKVEDEQESNGAGG